MSDPDLVISTQGLCRRFGKLVAVDGVSLDVRRGEVFGVLGPNGAGKSTTIRMLCGILRPSAGSGTVLGLDVVGQSELIKQRIGYMTQRFSLYDDLSVDDNLRFYAGLYNLPFLRDGGRIAAQAERYRLTERRHQITGTLSGGWKQRLALACATIHNPPLLFLDEPTAGVDPVSRREFWDMIHGLAAGGTTVLFTTHYMDEAERSHRLAFIFGGKLLDVGTPAQVVERRSLAVLRCALPAAAQQAASAALAGLPGLVEVGLHGTHLRIVAKAATDLHQQVRVRLAAAGIADAELGDEHADVEDAFVALVRIAGGAA